MARIRLLLPSLIALLIAVQGTLAAPQKAAKKPDFPSTRLVVPTWTDHKDTLPMDLAQFVYATPPPAIPMEDALREEQKNPKQIIIVPAPPPPPGNGYIPPKYPVQKKD